MLAVKGRYQNGAVELLEPVQHREGKVLVIFLDEDEGAERSAGQDGDALNDLIEECQIETGIADLADQHDHYLHGKPKRVADC